MRIVPGWKICIIAGRQPRRVTSDGAPLKHVERRTNVALMKTTTPPRLPIIRIHTASSLIYHPCSRQLELPMSHQLSQQQRITLLMSEIMREIVRSIRHPHLRLPKPNLNVPLEKWTSTKIMMMKAMMKRKEGL
jgi:hypothetical protein